MEWHDMLPDVSLSVNAVENMLITCVVLCWMCLQCPGYCVVLHAVHETAVLFKAHIDTQLYSTSVLCWVYEQSTLLKLGQTDQ